jgi:hypothetical protein
MRGQFSEVEEMISALKGTSGAAAAIPLLMIALAMGVMVAGVASFLFGALKHVWGVRKFYPKHVDYVALFKYSADQLQIIRYSGQTDQAYQNMTFALFISLFFVGWSLFWEHRPIDHGQLMFAVNLFFALAMAAASIRYNVRFWQLLAALASSTPAVSSQKEEVQNP